MKHGKQYIESAKTIDKTKLYEAGEGIEAVLATAKAKFDETVELHVRLGVDPKQADQQVKRPTRRKPPARTMSARKSWCRRSRRKTGSISTSSSPLPT